MEVPAWGSLLSEPWTTEYRLQKGTYCEYRTLLNSYFCLISIWLMSPKLTTFNRGLDKKYYAGVYVYLLTKEVGCPEPGGVTAFCNFDGRALKGSEESGQTGMAGAGEALQKGPESEADSWLLSNTRFAKKKANLGQSVPFFTKEPCTWKKGPCSWHAASGRNRWILVVFPL